ncbi:hypothetical protein CN896_31730 [Bacillus thuringiensis]|uniref:hypothetical protein n=1 Tax=Bacillus thuringiensis TaxID=1428 RepID=UPI000BFCC010|nr:hypothetical protein [Bacillus thuringiensis]PGH65130.1 hypothetical protein CN896_31730 [Bacillus thuringiensis]
MGDVDVNAEIFTNVVAKRNRNVSVKNVIVKQNRNAIVGMKRKGINNKKEYDTELHPNWRCSSYVLFFWGEL